MSKKLIFCLLLFVLGIQHSHSQRLQISLENEKKYSADIYCGLDNFRNIYYIKNNVFIKESDNQKWEYKNVPLGRITSVDIINPLQIVLFYEQFNTAIMLDNQLNEIRKIDFTEINSSLIISKIGLAGQNQFWIYNAVNQKLILFDYLKNNVKELPIPIENDIKFYQTDFNTFYWVDEFNNWYSCDIFGKKTLLANIPAFEKIQIADTEKLLFSVGQNLYFLNTKTQSVIEIEIVENSFENFYYKDQILSIFTSQEIKNYKIKLP
jgi:hypothetical protein